jgi:hypothetical protein
MNWFHNISYANYLEGTGGLGSRTGGHKARSSRRKGAKHMAWDGYIEGRNIKRSSPAGGSFLAHHEVHRFR